MEEVVEAEAVVEAEVADSDCEEALWLEQANS